MYGVQSHEVRQETLAEHRNVRRVGDSFFPRQARQSSSACRCVSQIENYIKESMKAEMAQLQQSAVHNHTAAMLEMGTNLLSQTAEQTRKLTDVETQVRTVRSVRKAACRDRVSQVVAVVAFLLLFIFILFLFLKC